LQRADPPQLTPTVLRSWPLPGVGADKVGRGTLLVVGGSSGTLGAPMLAGLAALRMGAGVLQLAVPDDAVAQVGVAVPEALVLGWSADVGRMRPRRAAEQLEHVLTTVDAILIGPGMLGAHRTARFVEHALSSIPDHATIVLDAMGLAALGRLRRTARDALRRRLVLTPNRSELAALSGAADDDDLDAQTAAVGARYDAAVTCFTAIAAADGHCWRSPDGGSALGTSGSGDVLAGLIAGAAARGAEPAQAAVWGTFVHACCGHRLTARMGPLSVIARDLLDESASVMSELDGVSI
jgi:hydroxyethylthiazole kinase-like uncharacterized protein yjeF